MTGSFYVTGVDGAELGPILEEGIAASQSNALFVGCAYVSIFGAEFLKAVARRARLSGIWLVADTRDGITHPAALKLALDEGWSTRIVRRSAGTFHPKVFMGAPTKVAASPPDVRMLILGSNNLSRGGLIANVEATSRLIKDRNIASASRMASTLWNLGVELTATRLSEYEAFFQAANRSRSIRDMKALGVSDEPDLTSPPRVTRTGARSQPSFSSDAAKAVWVGLETQTGEHRFQPELPKKVAEVLRSIVGTPPVTFQARCEDGQIRPVLFEFYPSNDMHRLNIPNDVPGVQDARLHRIGVALIESDDTQVPPLSVRVIIDPAKVQQVEARSAALGTWDNTPTRFYGWY